MRTSITTSLLNAVIAANVRVRHRRRHPWTPDQLPQMLSWSERSMRFGMHKQHITKVLSRDNV